MTKTKNIQAGANVDKTLKGFEMRYLWAERFLPALYQVVRRRLLDIAKHSDRRLRILDVGGRKSHYTIGVPADVTITDIPRQQEIQHQLHLGINTDIISQIYARRSNITAVQYDDMTRSALASDQFDCVTAVEVLEHITQDADFVREVHRVLKPGGIFLMTTPNGQCIENTNPDHRRHYTKERLRELLASRFPAVTVEYAVRGGFFYNLALRSWSLKRPVYTVLAMVGGFVNSIQSAEANVRHRSTGTQELLAVAGKDPGTKK
jgi:SAM-dependent methyltransferase